MTLPAEMPRGLALRAYLGASYLFPIVAGPVLRRRLRRGKEDPTRWMEKLGLKLAPRPAGPLIWLHAVGLGEVMSLRGLITQLARARPELSFLVTSGTAASARVFARNAPPRTLHQFLPLDAPRYRRRFLDHFAPDLCVWAEQDLWPGMVSDLAKRGIPQTIVAGRMNAGSYRRHTRVASLYRNLYATMSLVSAQDETSAAHLAGLGADVKVHGSLKPAAPALTCDRDELARLRALVAERRVWAVAPAHPDDISRAQEAHRTLCQSDPDALLIIAPRFPATQLDIDAPRWSAAQRPQPQDPIWLCDTFGDLGLVYRLADAVLIGGTYSDIEGHNPWEAAALDCAILHGPRMANFARDFAQLKQAHAAMLVTDSAALVDALISDELAGMPARAKALTATAQSQVAALAADLIGVMEGADAR